MSGHLGQFGVKTESVWGTAVTVDTFHPGWLSGNPTPEQPGLESMGIRAGRRTPHCVSPGPRTVGGTVSCELMPQPLAMLLRHMFGTVNTTGSGPYTHTASPGTLNGKSFTAQFGIGDTGSTVRPFTFAGCKLPGWSIKASAGEIAQLDLEISAKDYVTATVLASASYPDRCPFTFVHGSVSLGGSSLAQIKDVELAATVPLRTDGFYLGAATIREQLEAGRRSYVFNVTTEFESLTVHDLANTTSEVILTFNNGTETLTITSDCWVQPTMPTVQGVDAMNELQLELVAKGATDADAITAVLINSETTSA